MSIQNLFKAACAFFARVAYPEPCHVHTEDRPKPLDVNELDFVDDGRPLRGATFTLLWKVSDAIIVTMLRESTHQRWWTAEMLAKSLTDCKDFAFECGSNGLQALTPQQVNAALSGISTRAHDKRKHYVTDVLDPTVPVETGLKTPWRKRVWFLTPEGAERARTKLSASKHHMEYSEKMRAARGC